MKSKQFLIIVIILIGISAYLFHVSYNNVKQDMIRDLSIIFVCIFASFFLLKAWPIVREQEKRRKAEKALKENEKFLRLITENVQDAIRVLDLKTFKYIYANPYALARFSHPDRRLHCSNRVRYRQRNFRPGHGADF